ncbi:DUF5685 family protein [Nonomuraea cavernae]|uniref:Regulatory protein n=1 Tax=Nonomuraea cavernae TaxID=2045107 RepID=A0A917YNZ1_9ACTN|nr:DUF5685 family protein [Nonomuraea cavernae]MCA2183526.1 DUF5685 family protein [Nonomuraea cavernae]GGO60562.1 hypothetical protein GCM10012289_00720 [Nonomuraea cavernae]
MFGIVRPCQHVMRKGLYADWMGHLCGLCLALRDEHGQLSRLVTNYDGLLVSVLTEAQSPASAPRRRAGACALRGFKGADVVEAEGVRLAASVSLLLAAGKMRDHVADGDGVYARRPVAAGATRLARRWSSAGTVTAATLGFDPAPLTEAARRQALLERGPASGSVATRGLPELTRPTEDAVAAAFAHTAVLTGKPHNQEALEAAGRGFGRLAHLIDAVEDLADDRASGAYNPLAATGTDLDEARRHCDAAHADLRAAVAELDLPQPGLTRALLVRETGRAVSRAFATAGTHGPGHSPGPEPGAPPGGLPPKRDPGGLLSLACAALTCCTCGLYRPAWDDDHESSFCRRCDCSGYDCCCDCGNCCSCGSGEDGCGCDCC